VIPLFDFAVNEIGREISTGNIVQDAFGIVGLHSMHDHQGKAWQPYVGQRFLEAGAKAAHTCQNRIGATALDGFGEGVVKSFCTVASTASAHPNSNSGHGWNQLGQARFPHSTESANILNSRHQ
jgi:hypothetical protein